MTKSAKSIRRGVAFLVLATLAGCATTKEAEPPAKTLDVASAAWVRAREGYYREIGWSTLDARDQAEHDLEAGRTPPVERAHMARGRPVN